MAEKQSLTVRHENDEETVICLSLRACLTTTLES